MLTVLLPAVKEAYAAHAIDRVAASGVVLFPHKGALHDAVVVLACAVVPRSIYHNILLCLVTFGRFHMPKHTVLCVPEATLCFMLPKRVYARFTYASFPVRTYGASHFRVQGLTGRVRDTVQDPRFAMCQLLCSCIGFQH